MNSIERTATYRRQFAGQVLCSNSWLQAAKDLLETVKLLEPALRRRWRDYSDGKAGLKPLVVHDTFLMLLGLTAENMLKSRIVKYDRHLLQREIYGSGKLPSVLKGNHDLIALANRARINLSPRQRELLMVLREAVRWSGRYPVPTSANPLPLQAHNEQLIDELKDLMNDLFRIVTSASPFRELPNKKKVLRSM